MEIWHNPRCTKSRAAKAALDEAGLAYRERRYLDDPPTEDELDEVLTKIGKPPWEVARLKEPTARELGLRDLEHDRKRWIALMVAHPVLIERPIILTDDGRALIARDPVEVQSALDTA